jgi:aminoglycoside phosphotransferase family enzyme
MKPTLPAKVAFLASPAAYSGHARHVQTIETHFSFVFLAGSEAFKLKKPLRHRQLDNRTLEARETACLEELRLNRRLAPTIYRSVEPLRQIDGRFVIGGAKGEVVDWLIRMRRLPETKMLDHALRNGSVHPDQIGRVAARLAGFYATATEQPLSGPHYLLRLSREVGANHREICRYTDRMTQWLATEVQRAQHTVLCRLRPELALRAACVVEGHGDLRAEHVYLGSRIAVIDALEFDRQLRLFDPAEEVSLLALEIERLGRGDLADKLMQQFCRDSDSTLSREVLFFYRSHRAATRAKLAAWHLGDAKVSDPAHWIERTESLLNDALRYARAATGAPGLSVADRRPAMQQRSQRRAADHAAYGFSEEGGHMQFS